MFGAAAFGVLGYECDLRDLNAAQQQQIKNEIGMYKHWRRVLQFGQFYRVRQGNIHQWLCVSEDRSCAVGLLMQELNRANTQAQRFYAVGLDPERRYRFYNIPEQVDIKLFGSLINTIAPIHIRQDSLLHNAIARRVRMDGERERCTAKGAVFMRAGAALSPAFSGTGFDERVRVFPDFAARLYFFESEQE